MLTEKKITNDKIAQYKIQTYTLDNFRNIPQIESMSEEKQFEIEVVGNVFPFKTNNYVIEQLIDWNNIPHDPLFILNFPQKNMLSPTNYQKMKFALDHYDKKEIVATANEIRMQLNPHPAGQLEFNIPKLQNGTKLLGMQHKYKETCLFFPSQSQTCHAYCTFCFRWPQFVGIDELKFATNESNQLIQYLQEHDEITDILFTGGDPMIMNSRILSAYIDTILDADLPNLKSIRIGSKSLSYWPYKFITDRDSEDVLELFSRVTNNDINLAFMAHFNHLTELSPPYVKLAIKKIHDTGAQIRTQSPVLSKINDNSEIWSKMWNLQVQLGCIPYYMFVVRDTGAQQYFGIPLVKAYDIFVNAYKQVSGLARTVRGPSMSATPGKILIDGIVPINKKKFLSLRFLQGRNPDWVQKPFYAEYDEKAMWISDLKPAFSNKFFFEEK